METEEWERRYKSRIVERSGASEAAAHETLIAVPIDEQMDGFENDPEGAADEEMSNWTDDGE